MGDKNFNVTLYSPQAKIVTDTLSRDGICFSRREYVEKKYGESAPIFLAAYDWFVREAPKHLPKPPGAEYPYWAFADPKSVDMSAGTQILTLKVPVEEAVFFDLYDWNKILCLSYIGETEQEEKKFRILLKEYGIKKESDVILTGFYPDLKYQVMESWKRLFTHNQSMRNRLLSGQVSDIHKIQAGLWRLKKEWEC